MTLGTRVAVLKDGELMQINTPQSLFDAPENLFVATFIGSPAMNLADAKLVRDQGPALVFAEHKVPIAEQLVSGREGLDQYFDKDLIVGLRPSSMEDGAFAPAEWPQINGEVAVTEELAGEGHGLWTTRVNPKTQARVGRTIDLAVDTSGSTSSTKTPAWPSATPTPPPTATGTPPDGLSRLRSVAPAAVSARRSRRNWAPSGRGVRSRRFESRSPRDPPGRLQVRCNPQM